MATVVDQIFQLNFGVSVFFGDHYEVNIGF